MCGILLDWNRKTSVSSALLYPSGRLKDRCSKASSPDNLRDRAIVCAMERRFERGVAGTILSALLYMCMFVLLVTNLYTLTMTRLAIKCYRFYRTPTIFIITDCAYRACLYSCQTKTGHTPCGASTPIERRCLFPVEAPSMRVLKLVIYEIEIPLIYFEPRIPANGHKFSRPSTKPECSPRNPIRA